MLTTLKEANIVERNASFFFLNEMERNTSFAPTLAFCIEFWAERKTWQIFIIRWTWVSTSQSRGNGQNVFLYFGSGFDFGWNQFGPFRQNRTNHNFEKEKKMMERAIILLLNWSRVNISFTVAIQQKTKSN